MKRIKEKWKEIVIQMVKKGAVLFLINFKWCSLQLLIQYDHNNKLNDKNLNSSFPVFYLLWFNLVNSIWTKSLWSWNEVEMSRINTEKPISFTPKHCCYVIYIIYDIMNLAKLFTYNSFTLKVFIKRIKNHFCFPFNIIYKSSNIIKTSG